MTFMAALVLFFFFSFQPVSFTIPRPVITRVFFLFFFLCLSDSRHYIRVTIKNEINTHRLQICVLNEFVFDSFSYFRQSLVKCIVDVLHPSSLFVPSH